MNFSMFQIIIVFFIFCLIFGDLRTYKDEIKHIWYCFLDTLREIRNSAEIVRIKKITRDLKKLKKKTKKIKRK